MIYLEKDIEGKITFMHYMPFDNQHGLKKTKAELEQSGFFVEVLPEMPLEEIGKEAILYADPLRWVLVNRPLTRIERLQQLVLDGKITQEEMNELL